MKQIVKMSKNCVKKKRIRKNQFNRKENVVLTIVKLLLVLIEILKLLKLISVMEHGRK